MGLCQNRHIPPVAFQRANPALRQHTARRVRTVLRICPHHICIWDVGTRRAESDTFRVCDNNKRMSRF